MTDPAHDTEWEVVGEVAIDTGCMILADPVERDTPLLGEMFTEAPTQQLWARGANAVPVAVLVGTGDGDGIYQVEARRRADGRIAEVRVRFDR